MVLGFFDVCCSCYELSFLMKSHACKEKESQEKATDNFDWFAGEKTATFFKTKKEEYIRKNSAELEEQRMHLLLTEGSFFVPLESQRTFYTNFRLT